MARGSPNQASLLCKYLPCIFFLVLVSSKEFYIVPSQSYPCSADYCLTLSQFVSVFPNCSNCDNATLIFASEDYNLESGLIIENVQSFFMFAERFSFMPRIICHQNAALEFRNISTVTIDGIVFIECSGHRVTSVLQFRLTNSIFYNHPEIDDTTLTIVDSTTHLDRVAFLSTNENSPDRTNTSLPPQKNCALISAIVRCVRILIKASTAIISQNLFDNSVMGVGAVVSSLDSEIAILNSTFRNNRATHCSAVICIGAVLIVNRGIANIYDSVFEFNQGVIATAIGGIASFIDCDFSKNFKLYKDFEFEGMVSVLDSNLTINYSTFISNTIATILAINCNISISYSNFIGNDRCLGGIGGQTSIDRSTFLGNNGGFLIILDVDMVNIYRSEFVNNTMFTLIGLNAEMITMKFNEFTDNEVDYALVGTLYNIPSVTATNNEFIDNSAVYDIFIHSDCTPGWSTSLGSSHCIKCPERWYLNLAGLVVVGFVAGIVLVILMLALNFTVAIGTLNGILFYANIVASNTEAYFPLSSTPNFVFVIVSWLNLDIGFDVCFFNGMTAESKAIVRLAFPAYVISLVIIIIVVSECSSKFARIVGKGDPVAVLATMILISYTNCFKAVVDSVFLLYLRPAYGSLNFDPANFIAYAKSGDLVRVTDIGKALLVISPILFLLGLFFTALIFSWQWLVQHQDKKIFKWVRYQKLQHFIAPYHAPYATKYRYWTGLLLIVRIILFSVSTFNFSRDPRVDFVSTIFVIGCLMLFKGVIAKRIYKNVLLDVMETAIYFNLIFFAAFMWYSLDFGGNQVAVAYVSVIIVFALLLAVIVFHVLRFTSLHKLKPSQWTITKIVKKKMIQQEPVINENELDEIDGVLQQRTRPPYVSYSVVEMSQNEA